METLEEQVEVIIDEKDKEDQRREVEVVAFIEDFINSEEWHDILQLREFKNVLPVDVRLDIDEINNLKDTELKIENSPLTARSQKLWASKTKYGHIIQKQIIEWIRNHQENSISIIRQKIAVAKQGYLCHREERQLLKEQQKQKVLEALQTNYNIDISRLTTKSAAVEKVIACKKSKRYNKTKSRTAMINIIQKLLCEFKRKKEIDNWKNPNYDYKVFRKEKILHDAEIIGNKAILYPRIKPPTREQLEESPEEEPEVEHISKEALNPNKTKKDKGKKKGQDKSKSSKSSKSSGSKKDKIKKKSGRKKDKKSKNAKKSGKKGKGKNCKKSEKEEPVDLILPHIPCVNQRYKIKPEETEKMINLIPTFEALEYIKQDRSNYEKERLDKEPIYPNESNFHWRPKVLCFKDYQNKREYKKTIFILNGGRSRKKCIYYKTSFEDNWDPPLVEIEPIGAQNAVPGMSTSITVTFLPKNSKTEINANLMFLTYSTRNKTYSQFLIPMKCIPLCASINIFPNILEFQQEPIWEANRINKYKCLQISNTANVSWKIALSKTEDNLETRNQWTSMNNEFMPTENAVGSENTGLECTSSLKSFKEENLKVNSQAELNESEVISNSIINECITNVFNIFTFDNYMLNIPRKSQSKLKVCFKNIDRVGDYFEKFAFNIYEPSDIQSTCLHGTQEIIIKGSTTGSFINIQPEVLDFSICVFDSAYQLRLNILNNDHVPHRLRVQFPKSLRKYLLCSPKNAYIQAKGSQPVFIKFIPRIGIIVEKVNYYDPETSILEFPVNLVVSSTHYPNIPSTKLTIIAILTKANGLSIKPTEKKRTSCIDGDYMIDMGSCTTKETVFTEIELTNNSYTVQHYGFLDLPESITILPNYGFRKIEPLATQILTLMFSPEYNDIPNYEMEGELADCTTTFRISVNTIKNCGRMKMSAHETENFNRNLRRSLEIMEKELNSTSKKSIEEDIDICVQHLQLAEVIDSVEEEVESDTSEQLVNSSIIEEISDSFQIGAELTEADIIKRVSDKSQKRSEDASYNVISEETILTSNRLWIQTTIASTICDFSHQCVIFPDTPCGSYSIMTVELRGMHNFGDVDCVCGHLKKFSKCRKHIEYEAEFQIQGDNPEFSVEPICGMITHGESAKITLIVRPELPECIIQEKAEAIEVLKLLEKKRLELELKREKDVAAKLAKAEKNKKTSDKKSKGKSKDKKGKKKEKGSKKDKESKKSKSSKKSKKANSSKRTTDDEKEVAQEPDPLPEIIIKKDEVVIDYFDLYPAEMCIWQTFEPYIVRANFNCAINFKDKDMKPEKFELSALCKVIKPDFIHNLPIQHINFGPTAIGTTPKKIITIQSIQNEIINPSVTLLSPTGPFICPTPRNVRLEPQHMLQLPLTFAPVDEKQVVEYFEITAGKTICSLITSGEGVIPLIEITPNFIVCRLEAGHGGFTDCSLEINNKCKAPIPIEFIKVCELEGQIKPLEKADNVDKHTNKTKKGKIKGKKNKNSKSSKKSKENGGKMSNKFSQELTEEEEFSLQNYFGKKEGDSYFEVIGGTDNNSIDVDPFVKKPIKLRFGIRPPPEEKKEGKRSKKGKKDKSNKSKSSDSTKTNKSQKNKKNKNSKKSKSSKGTKKSKKEPGPQKYYVAKYNIMLGKITFIQDVIIVGTFT